MPTTGLSMLTDGWHHPGLVEVEVCDSPAVTAVVEVRPTIRATVPPPTVGQAGEPTVVAADEVRPEIRDTEGPQQSTGQEEPTVVAADEVVPQIRKAEEE